MPNSPTLLGSVQDVQGARVSIGLDQATVAGLVFIEGHGYRIGQVGSFVRIPIGLTDLYGVVSQVGAGAVPESRAAVEPFGNRWMTVQLVGEGTRTAGFQRGITQYPTIGDEAHVVTEGQLARIYGHVATPGLVTVGRLASAEAIPALLDANRLVMRHSAVLGMTGSGKSTTVTTLLRALSDPTRFPASRVLVFDLHGEYASALGERAEVFRINADADRGEKELYVPLWALSFDEFLRVTPFRGIGDTERAALAEKVRELKRASLARVSRAGTDVDSVTVDTPVPFSIHRLWYELYRLVCSTHTVQQAQQGSATEAIERDANGQLRLGDLMRATPPQYRSITAGGPDRVYLAAAPVNLRRQLIALQGLLHDSRFDFLFRPGPWGLVPSQDNLDRQPEEDLDTLLKAWVGGPAPVTVLDLSGVPTGILMDLVGVLIRLLFDAMFWARRLSEGARARPLLFVMEEAHAYLNTGNDSAAAVSARRVVKEGRKYGIGAMVVSQRPAEIDATILSQLGTTVAMRLANSTDRGHVSAMASDGLEGLLGLLPTLRTGEAIIVGEAVDLPLRAMISAPPPGARPDSDDPRVYNAQGRDGWNGARRDEDYSRVMRNWREERASAPSPESSGGM